MASMWGLSRVPIKGGAMKKLISLSLLAAWLLSGGVAFASVGVQDSDGSELGPVMSLKEGTGMTFTVADGVLSVGGGSIGSDGNWTSDGLAVSLDLAPTKFIATASSGDFAATGFTVGTGDLTFGQGGKVDGDTNGTMKLIEASDTLSFIFTGTTIQLDSSDGGFQFGLTSATEGQVDFLTNNDTDDYLVVKTASNVPTIATLGTSNLEIVPDGGTTTITGAAVVSNGLTSSSTITLENSETIVNSTNNTVEVGGGTNTILSVLDTGTSDSDAMLLLRADASADNGDDWRITSDGGTNSLLIENDTSGSQATILTLSTAGLLTTTGDVVIAGTTPFITVGDAGAEDAGIIFDGNAQDFHIGLDDSADDLIIGLGGTLGTTKIIAMTDTGVTTIEGSTDGDLTVYGAGTTASDAKLKLVGDAQTDVNDSWQIWNDTSAAALIFGTDDSVAGTYVTKLTLNATGDITMAGTTPYLTIGDAGAEDAGLAFDGNAQDFNISLDDSVDKLVIGLGTAAGTTNRMAFNSGDLNIVLGDASAADGAFIWDGNAQDFHVGIDDSADDLVIGVGSVLGTTQAMSIDENRDVTVQGNLITDGALSLSTTVQTFTDSDATPDVSDASYFNTNTTSFTITDFDGAGIITGQVITVVSKGAITYDVTTSGLIGGTTDIVTAASDVTTWIYDGTDWRLMSYIDINDNLN